MGQCRFRVFTFIHSFNNRFYLMIERVKGQIRMTSQLGGLRGISR